MNSNINKLSIIIIVLIILLMITLYFNNKKENKIEGMININYTPTMWNRNKCEYIMNETFMNEFKKYSIKQNKNNWNLLLPCAYDNPTNEMKQIKQLKSIQ